jgi:2-haloacid dehalogenase
MNIIFDFGGVLIDWDPRYLYRKLLENDEAIERFLAEIGFHEWNLKQDAGRSFADGVEELSALFPQYRELIAAYDARYEESITGPNWETVDILRALKKKGYALFGLSNWSTEKFLLVKKRYDFFNLFEKIILSGEVGLIKPDPRIFELASKEIGSPAEECLLIDDSATNIETARRLGFETVHYLSSAQLREALARRGILDSV